MKFRFGGKRRKNSSKVALSSVLPDWKYPAAMVSSYRSVSSPITVSIVRNAVDQFEQLGRPFQDRTEYVANPLGRAPNHVRRRRDLEGIGRTALAHRVGFRAGDEILRDTRT